MCLLLMLLFCEYWTLVIENRTWNDVNCECDDNLECWIQNYNEEETYV